MNSGGLPMFGSNGPHKLLATGKRAAAARCADAGAVQPPGPGGWAGGGWVDGCQKVGIVAGSLAAGGRCAYPMLKSYFKLERLEEEAKESKEEMEELKRGMREILKQQGSEGNSSIAVGVKPLKP